jgi:outer membrane lipoprotein-sorting protein
MLQRRRVRWLVPAAAVAAVGIAVVGRPIFAGASPGLPERTPAQVLAAVTSAGSQPFSGTIVETASLGLPSLPQLAGEGPTSLTSLVSGSHTARVWYDGPERVRFALLGPLAETDVVRNGTDLWMWESSRNQVQHTTLPADSAHKPSESKPIASLLPSTPADVAARALAAVDPTTRVTVDGTARVAGRSAYELVLAPRDTRSLVGQVRIAVDAKTSLPLRVQVFAKGGTSPAFESGFTSVSMSKPSAAEFSFSTPPGATVKQSDPSGLRSRPETRAPSQDPIVVGKGWTSVVVLRGTASDQVAGGPVGALLQSLRPVHGAYGDGRVLQTKLVSVLALDDGRVLIGAVTPSVLEEAAASPEAAGAAK